MIQELNIFIVEEQQIIPKTENKSLNDCMSMLFKNVNANTKQIRQELKVVSLDHTKLVRLIELIDLLKNYVHI